MQPELPSTQPKAFPQNIDTEFINLIFLDLTHLSSTHLPPVPCKLRRCQCTWVICYMLSPTFSLNLHSTSENPFHFFIHCIICVNNKFLRGYEQDLIIAVSLRTPYKQYTCNKCKQRDYIKLTSEYNTSFITLITKATSTTIQNSPLSVINEALTQRLNC